MKLITRSAIALVFLLGFATPLLAASPDVAVCIKPAHNCFAVSLKNLHGSAVAVSAADLTIFDQKSCKQVCATKAQIGKTLDKCATTALTICCNVKPLPPQYIVYVRVYHNVGVHVNEGWYCMP